MVQMPTLNIFSGLKLISKVKHGCIWFWMESVSSCIFLFPQNWDNSLVDIAQSKLNRRVTDVLLFRTARSSCCAGKHFFWYQSSIFSFLPRADSFGQQIKALGGRGKQDTMTEMPKLGCPPIDRDNHPYAGFFLPPHFWSHLPETLTANLSIPRLAPSIWHLTFRIIFKGEITWSLICRLDQ